MGNDHVCAGDNWSHTEEGLTLGFVMRHGRRIEIIDRNEPDPKPKKRRKPFEPLFVQVPRHWVNGLGQSKRVPSRIVLEFVDAISGISRVPSQAARSIG